MTDTKPAKNAFCGIKHSCVISFYRSPLWFDINTIQFKHYLFDILFTFDVSILCVCKILTTYWKTKVTPGKEHPAEHVICILSVSVSL